MRRGCPKFRKVRLALERAMQRGEKSIVRSDYKEQGTYLLSAYLCAHGVDHVYVNAQQTGHARDALIDAFNHRTPLASPLYPNRTYVPTVLLLDTDASEGISLLEVEHVHLLEPMLHVTERDQTVARAVRYKSHATLPVSRRTVHVHTHVASLDTHHLDFKGLGTILNQTPLGLSKALVDPAAQAEHLKVSLMHRRNIQAHLTRHFRGIIPRTGFTLVDYFLNPVRFIDSRYTEETTADTLVVADHRFFDASTSAYMAHAKNQNVLSEEHALANDCRPVRRTLKLRGFGR